MKEYRCSRLVKSEDLNHHGTLFAGRTAEWFVEAAFIAAASLAGNPENVVCINIHGLELKIRFERERLLHFQAAL